SQSADASSTRCRSERDPAPGVVIGHRAHLLTDPHGACMHSIRSKLAGALLVASASVALMASAQTRAPADLRVCADPYDLPCSNNQEEGLENKIAHPVAQDLNATVINYWWPSRRGVLRNSILGGFCDVMIQAPVGLDPVATTKPDYRSTYYFVFRADRGFALRS